MAENCLICNRALKKLEHREDAGYFDCGYCGPYSLTGTAAAVLRGTLSESHPETPRIKAVLSHAIKRRYEKGTWVKIDSHTLEQLIRENWLPSLPEQANNLVRWLGDNQLPGEGIQLTSADSQNIIGAETLRGVAFVIDYVYSAGLIDGIESKEMSTNKRIVDAKLSMSGWARYEELRRGAADARKAFMAMKYGEPEMDAVFEQLRAAVSQTGYDLVRLDKQQAAGLIDDKLRVEILTSRFLISDLTHSNPGAYWEAGYAEGLGKPVIYTCKKQIFDKQSTHFDTNHHLTVLWEPEKLDAATAELKATIRATLPSEAKMTD